MELGGVEGVGSLVVVVGWVEVWHAEERACAALVSEPTSFGAGAVVLAGLVGKEVFVGVVVGLGLSKLLGYHWAYREVGWGEHVGGEGAEAC